jgi:hypothetical protein
MAQKKVREKTSALRGLMRISMAYKEFTLHMRVFKKKLIHRGKRKRRELSIPQFWGRGCFRQATC